MKWQEYLHQAMKLKNVEISVLLILLCFVAGLWIFIEVADEVREGELKTFDSMILEVMRGNTTEGEVRGPKWVANSMREITSLGGMTVLSMSAVVTIAFLIVLGRGRTAIMVFCAAAGGIMLSFGLKYYFERPRPEESLHMVMTETFSFPSGHAMLSAVIYLTIGSLLAGIQTRNDIRTMTLSLAVFLVTLIGLSRIYLGVHYPTDVLGGWAIGLAWASLWWLLNKLHAKNYYSGSQFSRRGEKHHD